MKTGEFYRTIQGLISEGKSKNALQMLKERFTIENNPALNEVVIIMGEVEELNRLLRINSISDGVFQVRINGVNSSILKLIENYESNPITGSNVKTQNKNKFLFISIGLTLLIAISCICFFKYFNSNDLINQDEVDKNEIVTNLVEHKLGDSIYQEYRLVYLQGVEIKRYGVLHDTKDFIIRLEEFKDDDLEIHGKIFKHIGLMISNKIICLLTSSKSEQIDYSNRAISHANQSESLINSIQNIGEKEYRDELANWVSENKHLIRISINKFIASAVNYKAGGTVSVSSLKENFNQVANNDMLVNEGYKVYPIVKRLEEEKIISLKSAKQ